MCNLWGQEGGVRRVSQVAGVKQFLCHGHVPLRHAVGVAQSQGAGKETGQVVHFRVESLEYYMKLSFCLDWFSGK